MTTHSQIISRASTSFNRVRSIHHQGKVAMGGAAGCRRSDTKHYVQGILTGYKITATINAVRARMVESVTGVLVTVGPSVCFLLLMGRMLIYLRCRLRFAHHIRLSSSPARNSPNAPPRLDRIVPLGYLCATQSVPRCSPH